MRLTWVILGVIGLACLALILNHESGATLGLPNDEFASLVWYGLLAGVIGAAALPGRGRWREAARNALAWIAIILVLVTGYTFRHELQDIGSRMTAGLIPGSPLSARTADGRQQATLFAGRSKHFSAQGQVNGATIRFIVDTGASVVVLTQRDAMSAGIDVASLSYSAPVSTANGNTTAARVTLDRLSVGAIVRENVSAMVAQPGALETSLLGMSFLSTLWAFEFRADRMILTD